MDDFLYFNHEVRTEVQNWISNLPSSLLDPLLYDLELRTSGTMMARAYRLYRRLQGDYTAADFRQSDYEESNFETLTRREKKLTDLIHNSTLSEKTKRDLFARIINISELSLQDLTQIQDFDPIANSSSNQEANALPINNQDIERISDILPTAAIGNMQIPTTIAPTTHTNTNTQNRTGNCVTQPVHSSQVRSSEEDNVLVTLSNGTSLRMPRLAALELHKAQSIAFNSNQKTKLLEEKVSILIKQVQEILTSTKLTNENRNVTQFQNITSVNQPSTSSKNVNFQETYDLQYFDTMPRTASSNLQLPRSASPQEFRNNQNRNSTDAHTQNLLGFTDNSAINLKTNLDIGKMVRSWNIRFSGQKGECVEEFLQRVHECRVLANIPENKLLDAITELTDGVARPWARNSRRNWLTWNDFCKAARLCYGTDRELRRGLTNEAYARTQGKDEPVRDYIICLLSILDKFEEPWSEQKRLDLLHQNMLPELQKMVRRNKINSINSLMLLTREAEDLLSRERNYKPPPPPEKSLFPSMAYEPSKNANDNAKINIAAVEEQTSEHWKSTKKKLEETNGTTATYNVQQQDPSELLSAIYKEIETLTAHAPSIQDGKNSSVPNSVQKSKKRSSSVPASDKNKNKDAGPTQNVICFGCSWPGYKKPDCPECSPKE